MDLPCASYVYLDEKPPCLGFVYEEQQPGVLGDIVAALRKVSGIAWQPPALFGKDSSVVFVAILRGVERGPVIAELKKALPLKLPITMYELRLTVKRCRVDQHNEASAMSAFIPGFQPPNEQEFWDKFYARVTELRLRELISFDRSEEATSTLYVNAVKAILLQLGVFVQDTILDMEFCC